MMKLFDRRVYHFFINFTLVTLTSLFVLCASVMPAQAAFNRQINYQGRLTTSSGAAVADAAYSIKFSLYTVATGGSNIWTETQTVNTSGGLFSVMLGTSTSLASVDFNQTLYLGVDIESPTNDSEMTPRKILGVVPAAVESDKLDGLDSTQFLRADATNSTSTASTYLTVSQAGAGRILDLLGTGGANMFTVLSSGNVGVGTTSPYAKLSVAGETVAQYFTATSTSATSTLPHLEVANQLVSGFSEFVDGDGRFAKIYRSSGGNGRFSLFNGDGVELSMESGDGYIQYTDTSITLFGGTAGYALRAVNLSSDTTSPIVKIDAAAGGESVFQAFPNGKIGVGTSTPVSTLSVQGSLCVRDTGTCGTTAGTIYATNASVQDIDLAENYPTYDETIESGDIVALSDSRSAYTKPAVIDGEPGRENIGTLVKATAGGSGTVLGIVSTSPGLLFGYGIKGVPVRPVALAGRVPLKVSLAAGEIQIGDRLTTSPVPGVGMKATKPTETTVGVALEPFTAGPVGGKERTGKIVAFVNLDLAPLTGIEGDTLVSPSQSPIDWSNVPAMKTAAIAAVSGTWSISEDGRLVVREVQTDKLCLGETCVTETELKKVLKNAGLIRGKPRALPVSVVDPVEVVPVVPVDLSDGGQPVGVVPEPPPSSPETNGPKDQAVEPDPIGQTAGVP